MSKISLKEKVALITGAGGALGRSHALCLATLGAKIIVNDVGGSVSGVGQDRTNAEETASLIRSMGVKLL
ncbi:MAG: hypothetical protein IPJ69_14835 [Deltaproteobacteria bacterium]|nr:MAG: hypothetical protein IPJ69_14835 [Deltaproteobacteria bacterium]